MCIALLICCTRKPPHLIGRYKIKVPQCFKDHFNLHMKTNYQFKLNEKMK